MGVRLDLGAVRAPPRLLGVAQRVQPCGAAVVRRMHAVGEDAERGGAVGDDGRVGGTVAAELRGVGVHVDELRLVPQPAEAKAEVEPGADDADDVGAGKTG